MNTAAQPAAATAVAATAATASAASAEVAEDFSTMAGKEGIYARLGEAVKTMTGKRVGKSGGRKLFDQVVQEVFALATHEGTFRFNAGFGSMHVRTYKEGSRRLPNGQTTTFGLRKKLRYEEGVVVAELVKNGGDLPAALRARGAEAAAAEPAAAGVVALS